MNKVELRGIVGNSSYQKVGDHSVIRFSLVTKRVYRDASGEDKVESTWHNVNAWEGSTVPDAEFIKKGAKLQVIGRIRNTKVQNPGQPDRYFSEIQASEVKVYGKDETLAEEMN